MATAEAASRGPNDTPCLNSNFRVHLGYGDPQAPAGGFCEVVFPTFRIDACEAEMGAAASPCLVLRRGVTGALDLYAWWDKARRGKAPRRRTVRIELLTADHAQVVMTWCFRNAVPVSLSYSTLNAMECRVQLESIELAFDTMELR